MIEKNVGKPDRVIRVVAGAGFWYLAAINDSLASLIFLLAGTAAVGTGLAGWCGLYKLLGVNTCGSEQPK